MPLQLLNPHFRVSRYTGGSQPGFDIAHVLDVSDATVHCSTPGLDQTLQLEADGEGVYVSHVVIRAPIRGYGEPLRAGLVWLNGEATPAAAYDAYDVFDLDEAASFPAPTGNMMYFETEEFMECVLTVGEACRQAPTKELVVKFADTHGAGDNVDVTFVAVVGSTSPFLFSSRSPKEAALDAPPPRLALPPPISANAAGLLEQLGALRPRLSGGVDALDKIMHYIGHTTLVLGVGTHGDPLDAEALLKEVVAAAAPPLRAALEGGALGFACTANGSKEAQLLRRQFHSPDRPHVAVLYAEPQIGQFVMGEAAPTPAEVEAFLLRFLNGGLEVPGAHQHRHDDPHACHNHDHHHDHHHEDETAKAEASDDEDEELFPALATPDAVETFLEQHCGAAAALVVTTPWCGACRRGLPVLHPLLAARAVPTAAVSTTSPAAAVLPADVDMSTTPTVVLFAPSGAHTTLPFDPLAVAAFEESLDSGRAA